jgi:hypothetical protein
MSGLAVHRFSCAGSEWEFDLAVGDGECLAYIYRRGERYGPEFKAETPAQLQARIARWLLLHAEVKGGLS